LVFDLATAVLLKFIAALANSNDGAIFIGIDDAGRVRGRTLDFTQKDRFERKIRQLVRNRIKPTPLFEVTFEDVRGFAIAKIAVARGEAPGIGLVTGT
jgi:predicted HTH transcriptional regulator